MKRVLLYRFDRPPTEAIVSPGSYLRPDTVEFLTAGGAVQNTSYSDIKAICFASELGRPDLFTANNLFERRPKSPGLWARFTLRDGDRLDGILPHNLLEWPQAGYLVTPPKSGASRQRVFLPRASLSATELLGVVGIAAASLPVRRPRLPADTAGQLKIFDQ